MDTINVLAPTSLVGQLPFTLGDDILQDGAYKAIQEWVICFLTARGSVSIVPEYGSDFSYYLSSGAIRSTADVQTHFSEATAQVQESLVSEDDTETKVVTAHLVNYSVVERDLKRILIMEVAFTLSDGTVTRANLGVD